MKYVITSEKSLLEALKEIFTESSNTSLRSWLKEERVLVNGKITKNGCFLLSSGQEIALCSRKRRMPANISLIYEDQHFVIIDKPSGLLSVATAFDKEKTAHSYLKSYYPTKKLYVVHRLDQQTSGVMLFAFSELAYTNLKKMFEAHDIERSYTAIVEGKLYPDSGTWESFLYEDSNYFVHSSEDPRKGEKAITHFRVLKRDQSYSKLLLKLETGKKNQIRVHCQQAGHPIVGDSKYGSKHNSIQRLCLHAHLLSFKHPVTGKQMKFESSEPAEFLKILKHSTNAL